MSFMERLKAKPFEGVFHLHDDDERRDIEGGKNMIHG